MGGGGGGGGGGTRNGRFSLSRRGVWSKRRPFHYNTDRFEISILDNEL